jgi:hypothetical protein
MTRRHAHIFREIYEKYSPYTMIREDVYISNLRVAHQQRRVPGCIVECGTWRGGMIAGIADLLGAGRPYVLFDSFEGLPPARAIDGPAALAWQANKEGPHYHDNCAADIDTARRAMGMSKATDYQLIKGWFEETMSGFVPPCPIAILRLDCDWFQSTMTCLESLWDHLADEGVILIDDYYTWDGCSKAVHQFLAQKQSSARIWQVHGVCLLKPVS